MDRVLAVLGDDQLCANEENVSGAQALARLVVDVE